jgi:uncharacterized membrane-anchored protein YhcB (DUF1043 family)
MSTSTQNNGSEITADSIKTRLENIRDDSLPKLVENIKTLIKKYHDLQQKFNDQTILLANSKEEHIRASNKLIEEITKEKEQTKEQQKEINNLFEHLPRRIQDKQRTSQDILLIKHQIDGILDEKDAKIRSLSNKIIEITTTQQLLESQRNNTIDEMNKTAMSIIGQLEHISGSIKAADGSSGGKMKTRKILKSRRNHKKTRAKKRTLRRFKK